MLTEDAVYSDMVVIDAPVERVWQILLDFDNYAQWNSFCPQIKSSLKIGADVEMMVDLGNGLQEQVEQLERLEVNREIAWGMIMGDENTLRALRTQTLIAMPNQRCCYVTVDWFSGELTQAVMEGMGAAVEAGFNACAYGLKTYAEANKG